MANNNKFYQWILLTSRLYAWCPIALFAIHMIASNILGIYDAFPAFDIPMHFLGGFCIAYFWNGAYKTAVKLKLMGNPVPFLRYLLVFSLASTSTIVWEFAEFLGDHYLGTHMQGGIADTMADMFLGMLGGCVLLLIAKRRN
jgi:hypothetical protein